MPEVSRPASEPHPRPQLERSGQFSLNGLWQFALDPAARWAQPDEVNWNAQIRVPFAPETAAGGVANTSFFKACWYRRQFRAPALEEGQRLIVHFGAVDYQASVWMNGTLAVQHEGGHTPFSVDVTALLADGPQTIVVRAEDDPHDLAKPRGKQDWQLEPHSIWYPRTTGIWQTVWMEVVSQSYIGYLRWTPNVERWEIGMEVWIAGDPPPGKLRLNVQLSVGSTLLAEDSYSVVSSEVLRRIALSDPGIDDYRNELLWSPSQPTLIQARLQLIDASGAVIDDVRSYTALRSIAVQGDRFVLNGRPYQLRLVLDQGYWPETGLTPPSDEAIRRDIELVKSMGFNGVRKHQKIETPGFLLWADTLGLLVWEEMPSAYRYTRDSIGRLTREWMEVIERDSSHPCIIAWMPFNESWGVPDLPDSPAQRHYVQSLYHLTKTLDSTRPVIGNDGWESVATDIIGIHDYDDQPQRIAHRYGGDEMLPRLFKRERPGGRMLLLGTDMSSDQPIMLTEFGGIAYSQERGRTWGYTRVETSEDLANAYTALLKAVHACSILAGFCYTQFTDTYQEANGLLYADRTPKFPLEQIRQATRGTPHLEPMEAQWRERLMNAQRTQYLIPSEDYRTHHDR